MAINIKKIQVAAWAFAALLFFLHRFDRYDQAYTLAETLISFSSYILVIYGYSYFIYPRYYKKLTFARFILINCFFLYSISCLRLIAENLTTEVYYGAYSFMYWTRPQMAYILTTLFIAFIIGVLLRVSINHLDAKKETEELKRKHLETEKKFLKVSKAKDFIERQMNDKVMDPEADFFIKTGKEIHRLQFSAISHLVASREYIAVYTKNERHLVYKRMKDLVQTLPSWFMRIHNSYIINTRAIDKIENNHVIIGTDRFSISEKYREEFYKKIEARTI